DGRHSHGLVPPSLRLRSNAIDGADDALRRDVVDHVRATRQNVEPAAGDVSMQTLGLLKTDDFVRITGQESGRGTERALSLAEVLSRRDHMRRIFCEGLDLRGPKRQ